MRHPTLTGEALQDAIAEAAHCKATKRHALEPIAAPTEAPRPMFGSLFTQRCERCGTIRYDVVSRLTGQVISHAPTYDWPPWYQDAGTEGLSPDEWRAAWWAQLDPSLFLEGERVKPRRRTSSAKADVTPIRGRKRA